MSDRQHDLPPAWGVPARSCTPRVFAASNFQGYGMDLVEGVAGPLVDTLNGVGRVGLGQAVDISAGRVRPSLLEHDPLLILNGKVGVVSLLQTIGGDADHPTVGVHKLRHIHHLLVLRGPGNSRSRTPTRARIVRHERKPHLHRPSRRSWCSYGTAWLWPPK